VWRFGVRHTCASVCDICVFDVAIAAFVYAVYYR